MQTDAIKDVILSGRTALGVEFGSTRIKAVLIGEDAQPIASGSYAWENLYEHGLWTYHTADVWAGLQAAYREVRESVQAAYGVTLRTLGAIGFSGMMHGYMAFDKDGQLLVPFRTWRNTTTGPAARELTDLLGFNIPLRWSIAHLRQAILNQEPHVSKIDHLTTLAGYVHWKLTGKKVMGIGEASGMFPIDSLTSDFDARRLAQVDDLLKESNLPWTLRDILPTVLVAGEPAGTLTAEGAALIDPSGHLVAGIPLCPPEGDAGTGMVATNSVAHRTANVSAGTSVFAMIVLEQALSKVYPEIDLVTTPAGKPVAMVHSNNCTSDLNAWVGLFGEFAEAAGIDIDAGRLFELLYQRALAADPDGGGLLAYNFVSGEHIVHLEQGRPLFVRTPESHFTLANFVRTHLFASLGALKLGLDILFDGENVTIDRVLGHGGFFKTPEVGQRMMAAAMNVPVSVMETAGEGGAWGIALLADYMRRRNADETLEEFLENRVFAGQNAITVAPNPVDVEGFATFMKRFKTGLVIETTAVNALP
jgi:sugar (pentulose or hexulose) kinase